MTKARQEFIQAESDKTITEALKSKLHHKYEDLEIGNQDKHVQDFCSYLHLPDTASKCVYRGDEDGRWYFIFPKYANNTNTGYWTKDNLRSNTTFSIPGGKSVTEWILLCWYLDWRADHSDPHPQQGRHSHDHPPQGQ